MGSTALTVVRHFGSNKQALISLLKGRLCFLLQIQVVCCLLLDGNLPMSIRLARLDEQNINVNPTAPAK